MPLELFALIQSQHIFTTLIQDAILEWTRTVVLKLCHVKEDFYGSGSDFRRFSFRGPPGLT